MNMGGPDTNATNPDTDFVHIPSDMEDFVKKLAEKVDTLQKQEEAALLAKAVKDLEIGCAALGRECPWTAKENTAKYILEARNMVWAELDREIRKFTKGEPSYSDKTTLAQMADILKELLERQMKLLVEELKDGCAALGKSCPWNTKEYTPERLNEVRSMLWEDLIAKLKPLGCGHLFTKECNLTLMAKTLHVCQQEEAEKEQLLVQLRAFNVHTLGVKDPLDVLQRALVFQQEKGGKDAKEAKEKLHQEIVEMWKEMSSLYVGPPAEQETLEHLREIHTEVSKLLNTRKEKLCQEILEMRCKLGDQGTLPDDSTLETLTTVHKEWTAALAKKTQLIADIDVACLELDRCRVSSREDTLRHDTESLVIHLKALRADVVEQKSRLLIKIATLCGQLGKKNNHSSLADSLKFLREVLKVLEAKLIRKNGMIDLVEKLQREFNKDVTYDRVKLLVLREREIRAELQKLEQKIAKRKEALTGQLDDVRRSLDLPVNTATDKALTIPDIEQCLADLKARRELIHEIRTKQETLGLTAQPVLELAHRETSALRLVAETLEEAKIASKREALVKEFRQLLDELNIPTKDVSDSIAVLEEGIALFKVEKEKRIIVAFEIRDLQLKVAADEEVTEMSALIRHSTTTLEAERDVWIEKLEAKMALPLPTPSTPLPVLPVSKLTMEELIARGTANLTKAKEATNEFQVRLSPLTSPPSPHSCS